MKNLNQYIKEQEEKSHDKEIEALIKSVGGGTKSAGVFESWVHIVCSLSGKKTEPTVAQVKSASNHSEFHPEGKKWLDKIKFGTDKRTYPDEKVLEAIEYIGGDIKDSKMPISFPPADIIHNTITTNYYKKLPQIWKTEKTKENTADIVIITSGSATALSAALPDCTIKGSIRWEADGKCWIPDTGIEWYQISLKKGIDDARIGKLGEYLKGRYAGQKYSPDIRKMAIQSDAVIRRGNYLGVSYGFDNRIDQILLDEGLFDVFKAVKDKVVGSFKKLTDWAAGKLRKILGGVIRSAQTIMSSNPVIDNANEMLKIAGVRNLGEEVLFEKAIRDISLKDSEKILLLTKFKVFENQLASYSVNKEYDKIKINIANLNSKKSTNFKGGKEAVLFDSTDADAKIDENLIRAYCGRIIENLEKGRGITSKDLFLPLKVASHYTAYNAINVILKDIYSNVEAQGGVLMAAMGFLVDVKKEAKFGNTKLPLWIVYGSRGGAHYLGTKDTFEPLEYNELMSNPAAKAFDQPYVVIRIEKVAASGATYGLEGHNVTEVYLMSGIDERQEIPKYLLLNFTTSSGSKFTMKPEVEKELAKTWI
tara:strand:- start:208 stop:1983 length:1776 start_codon:yes stop_codon:yes gene_type:complete